MSYRHDEIEDDDDLPQRSAYNATAREVTLSTGTILGIFFGLVLLCAVFFGFGYNMGSKSHQAPVVATDATAPATTDFSTFKPSPGTPAAQSTPAPKPVEAAPTTADVVPAPSAPMAHTTPTPAPVVTKPATDVPAAPTRTAPPTEAGITFIVQVAAVSHQEDADLLVTALKRKGYSVVARTEAQDKLFHIQIGPFPSKKDADTMRQRLLGDGYNAIVK
jgi:DedD protein